MILNYWQNIYEEEDIDIYIYTNCKFYSQHLSRNIKLKTCFILTDTSLNINMNLVFSEEFIDFYGDHLQVWVSLKYTHRHIKSAINMMIRMHAVIFVDIFVLSYIHGYVCIRTHFGSKYFSANLNYLQILLQAYQ